MAEEKDDEFIRAEGSELFPVESFSTAVINFKIHIKYSISNYLLKQKRIRSIEEDRKMLNRKYVKG